MAYLMTLEEVADYLRVTRKTIYRLLGRSQIPASKVGRQWRFNKAAIDEWFQQTPSSSKANILVIDDEEIVRILFKETLEELGHSVVTAETGSKGLELVARTAYDLVFLDLWLPEIDGAELFERIRMLKSDLPVVIITGYPDSEMMERVLAHGPFSVMNKPFSESDIITAVNTYIRFTAK